MRKKPQPPTSPEARKNLGKHRHWQLIGYQRDVNDVIIPEFVQHWRPMILKAYQTGGLSAAEEQHASFVASFKQ